MPQLPWDLEFEASGVPDGARLTWAYDPVAEHLTGVLENTGADAVVLDRVSLTSETELGADGGFVWLHGRYMQQDAFVHCFGQPLDPSYASGMARAVDDEHRFRSYEVVVVSRVTAGTPVLLLGSVEPGRCFVDFELTTDEDEEAIESVALSYDLRGIELAAGGSYELPPVLVATSRDAVSLIERFAAETGEAMHARVPGHVLTGWCSWYYFYNRVNEADVVANLESLSAAEPRVEFVQIDDGFQSFTGDWLTPNDKFPSGMKALATRIREAGFTPGLWLAPFVLHEDSVALRDNPEMALKDAAGATLFVETWLGRCAVLDCTHPRAEAWLRNVIETVVHDWGYPYLKLDALSFAGQTATRVAYHTPGTTAPMNVRRGLEIIREAAGDSTFILGCTCHFGAAIGLVDAMRVGPDVKALWSDGSNPSAKHAMRMTLQRNWMHGRWWANDPDCLIVRDTDTELSEAETRFLASAIALSGGMIVASDDVPALSSARQAMAEALLPATGSAARPLEIADAPVPTLWRAELGDGRFLVGALNWSDEARWVRRDEMLRAGEVAFDLWQGTALGMGDRLLAPHEGVLLQVTAHGPTPRVVGDTGHVAYARLHQRAVSGRLQVRNDARRARTIAVQARGQVFEVELQPGEARWFD